MIDMANDYESGGGFPLGFLLCPQPGDIQAFAAHFGLARLR